MKPLSYLKLSASLLVALALGSATHAAQISGSITIGSINPSGVTLQDGLGNPTVSLTSARGVKSWGNVSITGASGSFSIIPNATTPLMTAPWIFTPSTPLVGLWSVTGGGETFTFDLLSSTVATQTPDFLSVTGTGTVKGAGAITYTNTPGVWRFSTQAGDAGGLFSWSASTVATPVPDGGTTMALFGLSLLGLYGVHRKFGKS
ncbi:MAG: VPDSG-CTERM sorting domain-containing protein [Verrucomicrobiota bacterium]